MKSNLSFIVIVISLILLTIIASTYYIDKSKSNWVSGPVLLMLEIVLFAIQIILLVKCLTTQSIKIKRYILIASLGILTFVFYFFIKYNMNTT